MRRCLAGPAAQLGAARVRPIRVAVARVVPLRLNLPTRGVRFSFAQVLQTELRKPMTIRLRAENTGVPNWVGRLGLGLLGFLVLWGVVAAINRRNPAAR